MNTRILFSRAALGLGALAFFATIRAADAPIAFPAPSPAATVKQHVGFTDIQIDYSRPGMKGRTIFGGLVPYGEVWRTGANQATKIAFSTPVKLNGTAIPAGSYELHTIPGPAEWTIIIHKDVAEWGSYTYDAKDDVARIMAKPTTLPAPVETFTIAVDDIRTDSALLTLSWDRTRVPVTIAVDVVGTLQPQIEAAMASDAAKKPYFQAAMFYYENGLDLDKAAQWMDAALAEQPDQMWMIYRQGLILAKKGDKAGARAAAQRALELATKAGGAAGEEYARLSRGLLASLE